jgi:two-component system CheB/CheR fusion protein
VVIQHLDPTHPSSLPELLKRYTAMSVREARDAVSIEPDHVYIIPPTKNIYFTGGILQLQDLERRPGESHTVDLFFKSLAEQLHDKAIGVILSGTGNDGVMGAKAIKSELGMVMVQDPPSAKYDGMPRAAILSGVADYVVSPDQMPAQIIEYVRQTHGAAAENRRETIQRDVGDLQRIFTVIRARTKHDFSGYKLSTINRRIERRMGVNQIQSLGEYADKLEADTNEVDALFKDLLINVTSFFRDPEAFESLKTRMKEILQRRDDRSTVRMWTMGCATGEEAYSLAITLEECMEENRKYLEYQVFGTDIDPDAITIARSAVYPGSIASDVGEERLKKFFVKKNSQYQVKKELREKLIFAIQDFIEDPPFSRVDIISARNVLIYLDSELQRKVIPLLHYALSDSGILFLGTAETVGEFADLFELVDRKWKIHRRKNIARNAGYGMPARSAWQGAMPVPIPIAAGTRTAYASECAMIQGLPPSVLLDPNYRICYVHGETARYLELSQGEPSVSILDMSRHGLRNELASALREASVQKKKATRVVPGYRVNGDTVRIKMDVCPVRDISERAGHLIVTFHEIEEVPKTRRRRRESEVDARVMELQQELQFTRESLRSTIEELETANEELRSANEEYQSTNEELETSREELQSLNDELMTINNECQTKIYQLSVINDDMKNLLNSTNVGTVFLDDELRIKRFTPAATDIFNLIESDIGRPIEHVTSLLNYETLIDTLKNVLQTLIPVREDVQTKNDGWYSMRINPYRTTSNTIAGLVLSFIDISDYAREKRKQ